MEATEESTGKNVELYEHFDVFPSVKQINRYPFWDTSLVQLNMCGEKPGKRLITQFGHAGVFHATDQFILKIHGIFAGTATETEEKSFYYKQ